MLPAGPASTQVPISRIAPVSSAMGMNTFADRPSLRMIPPEQGLNVVMAST
jgi:hypothetical protein